MNVEVCGVAQARFEPLREIFRQGFAGKPQMGAALSIWVDGENVLSLWGGVADSRSGKLWDRETATVVFSCTKGLVSILAAKLVQEGRLDYAAPVAEYWPEFAAAGKQNITVAQLLAHRAGLSAPRADLVFDDLLDWDRMTSVLAGQEPLWVPGSGYAYHALTHGWLAGELIRRVAGQTVGAWFNDQVAAPLGAPAWIGLPAAEAIRMTHIKVDPSLGDIWADEAAKPQPNWPYKAMTLGSALPPELISETGGFNNPALHRAEVPGAGGIATADGLAAIWSALVAPTRDVRLLSDAAIAAATTVQSEGAPVFETPGPYPRWGMGFQLDSEARRYLSADAFGHDGAGGQVAFADPGRRVGFAYITNWMMGEGDDRATRLINALRDLI